MVVIRVEPLSADVDMPIGYAYLMQLDTQAQTMQLADTPSEAMLFETPDAAALYWNTHMSQLAHMPPVSARVETPVQH